MRKFCFSTFKSIVLSLSISCTVATSGLLFFGSSSIEAQAQSKSVYIGGNTAGFLLNMGGIQVIALGDVVGKDVCISPAKESGIKVGDLIIKINDKKIDSVDELNEILKNCNGEKLKVTVKRGDTEKELYVTPQKDGATNQYKIGVLIRDSLSGIGTITYIDKETMRFGALGHGIYDENNELFTVKENPVYDCSIISVSKGVRGKAGELKGIFTGESELGSCQTVNDCGLFGSVNKNFDLQQYISKEVAPLSEAHIGCAYIYSTVSGYQPQKYEISIVKVDENNKENKNFVIKIKDPALLSQTGGIVQGMSGSPIIQDDKIIGAVTHVFLNDPTRGYGIGIEKMLNN